MDKAAESTATTTGFTVVCSQETSEDATVFRISGPNRLEKDAVVALNALIVGYLENQEAFPPVSAVLSIGRLHEILSRYVDTLEVSTRAQNVMARTVLPEQPYQQIGEIVTLTRDDFLAQGGCGHKSVSEIERALNTLGLRLGMREQELHGWQPRHGRLTSSERASILHSELNRPLSGFDIGEDAMEVAVKTTGKSHPLLGDLALMTFQELTKDEGQPPWIIKSLKRALEKRGLRLGLTEEQLMEWERPAETV